MIRPYSTTIDDREREHLLNCRVHLVLEYTITQTRCTSRYVPEQWSKHLNKQQTEIRPTRCPCTPLPPVRVYVCVSILDTPYNYETGVDLREQMTMCDAGDVFTIPANIEKTFDQISNAVAYVSASGAMPIIMGGDHSIGFPTVRG